MDIGTLRTLTPDEEIAILQRFKGGDTSSLSGLEAWIGWLRGKIANGALRPEFREAMERNLATSILALEKKKEAK